MNIVQSFISKTQEFSNLSIQNHSGKLAIVNQIYCIESKNVRILVFLASDVKVNPGREVSFKKHGSGHQQPNRKSEFF